MFYLNRSWLDGHDRRSSVLVPLVIIYSSWLRRYVIGQGCLLEIDWTYLTACHLPLRRPTTGHLVKRLEYETRQSSVCG